MVRWVVLGVIFGLDRSFGFGVGSDLLLAFVAALLLDGAGAGRTRRRRSTSAVVVDIDRLLLRATTNSTTAVGEDNLDEFFCCPVAFVVTQDGEPFLCLCSEKLAEL